MPLLALRFGVGAELGRLGFGFDLRALAQRLRFNRGFLAERVLFGDELLAYRGRDFVRVVDALDRHGRDFDVLAVSPAAHLVFDLVLDLFVLHHQLAVGMAREDAARRAPEFGPHDFFVVLATDFVREVVELGENRAVDDRQMHVHGEPLARDGVHDLLVRRIRHVEIVDGAAVAENAPAEVVDPRLEHALMQAAFVRIEAQAAMAGIDRVVGAARARNQAQTTANQWTHGSGLSRSVVAKLTAESKPPRSRRP